MKQQEDQLYLYSHKPRGFFLLLLINIFSHLNMKNNNYLGQLKSLLKKKNQ